MNRFRLTAPRPPKLSENDVEAGCLDTLRLRGYYPRRLHVGTFRTPNGDFVRIGESGLPDYIALHRIYPGLLFEAKATNGKLRPDQQRLIWELTQAYHLTVITANSTQVLIDQLNEHERKARERWREDALSNRES